MEITGNEPSLTEQLLSCQNLQETVKSLSHSLIARSHCDAVLVLFDFNEKATQESEFDNDGGTETIVSTKKEDAAGNDSDVAQPASCIGFFSHQATGSDDEELLRSCCTHAVSAVELGRLFPSPPEEQALLHVGGCLEIRQTTAEEDLIRKSLAEKLLKKPVRSLLCQSIPTTYKSTCFIELLWFEDSNASTDQGEATLTEIASFISPVLNRLLQTEIYLFYKSQYEAVLSTVYQLYHSDSEHATLQPLCDFARQFLDAEAVSLYYLQHRDNNMYLVRDSDGYEINVNDDTLLGRVAKTAKTVNLGGNPNDSSPHVKSLLMVPITDACGTVLAVLETANRMSPFLWEYAGLHSNNCGHEDDPTKTCPWRFDSNSSDSGNERMVWQFAPEDERVLVCACMHAGAVFGSMKYKEQSKLHSSVNHSILNVLRASFSGGNISEALETVADSALNIVAAQKLCLYLADRSGDHLIPVVRKNASSHHTIAIKDSLAGSALMDGITKERMDVVTPNRTTHVIFVPIVFPSVRRIPIGVLELHSLCGVKYSEQECEALESFCMEVGTVLKRRSVDMIFSKWIDEREQEQGSCGPPSGEEIRGEQTAPSHADDYEFSILEEYADDIMAAKLRKLAHGDASENTSFLSRDDLDSASTCTSGGRGSSFSSTAEAPVANTKQKDSILSWDTNILHRSHHDLKKMAIKILRYFDLLERFDISVEKLRKFVNCVESHYHDVPFHNFCHAMGAMHSTFLILATTNASQFLSYLDMLAMLISALCHDLDHPGHSQNYEVNSESELALRHNDTAVLESHHAHMTFKILRREQYNIFENLPRDKYRYCRKVMLKCIIGTDMAKHFSLVERLSDRSAKVISKTSSRSGSSFVDLTERFSSESCSPADGKLKNDQWVPFDADDESDRLELAEAIVHAADLSAQTADYAMAKEWGRRVFQEFRNEVSLHERDGLTPPQFMKKAKTEYDEYRMQPSFINKVLLPIWEQLDELIGGLENPIEKLRNNSKRYEEEASKLEKLGKQN